MWRANPIPLIPAQAGIQSDNSLACYLGFWVPAFAGTSGQRVEAL
jgi:hypothetical protein